MKKLLFILSVVVLVSCGKDDPNPLSNSKLVGTWTGVSSTTEMKVGDKTYKQYLIDQGFTEEEADAYNDLVEQLLTLTGYISELTVKGDGSYTGHTEFMDQTIDVTGTWKLSDDEKNLTLTNTAQPGVEKHGTVTKLTDTDFWMEVEGEEIDTPDGVSTELVSKVTVKFTRKK